MRILVSNDDGIDAPGIDALAGELRKSHDVVVVAPDSERSGSGHSFSANAFSTNWVRHVTPRYKDGQLFGYAVDGTPAESVLMGVILFGKPNPFDLVIAGINRGENVGLAKPISGTEAAARQARIMGIPAIAVSQAGSATIVPHYAVAAKCVRLFVEYIRPEEWKERAFWSINIPADVSQIKGVKLVSSNVPAASDLFVLESRTEADGGVAYKVGIDMGRATAWGAAIPEMLALYSGYITVSPQRIDTIHESSLTSLAPRIGEFEQQWRQLSASVFSITGASIDPVASKFTLTWDATAGASYTVERTAELSAAIWENVATIVGTGNPANHTETYAPAALPLGGFYRVRRN